jgi:glycosyltransferase involved in cell wall biosynthesis
LRNLSKILSRSFDDKKFLLTIGRLVERKGHRWFIQNVMPSLPAKYIYLVAGDGPEKDIIGQVISKKNLESRVFLLGKISDEFKKDLYNTADIFIMPNISIKGDMEGFGIVAIEAGSVGLPTIASNIEGIKDAILSGKTGWLVEEKNAKSFIDKIFNINLRKENVRQETVKNFSWLKIASKYLTEFKKLHN